LFGNIDWRDADKISQVIAEEIPTKVAADKAYQNAMKNSDKQNARIEHDKALQRVILELLPDHTELFKQFDIVIHPVHFSIWKMCTQALFSDGTIFFAICCASSLVAPPAIIIPSRIANAPFSMPISRSLFLKFRDWIFPIS